MLDGYSQPLLRRERQIYMFFPPKSRNFIGHKN